MPLTPTHVLAVVPVAAIADEALPFSALAIGSMIPDAPLFLPHVPGYQITHSLPGVFSACLPVGLAAFVVFQALLKRPLLALLPDAARRRCVGVARPWPGGRLSARGVVGVMVGIVVGALTHLVWDAFTHSGRFGTELIPWLRSTVLTVAGQPLAGYQVAQYGCSLVGLPLLGGLAWAWLRRQEPAASDDLPEISRAGKIAAALGAVAIPAAVSLSVWSHAELTAYQRLGDSITGSGTSLLAAAFLYGLAVQAGAVGIRRPSTTS